MGKWLVPKSMVFGPEPRTNDFGTGHFPKALFLQLYLCFHVFYRFVAHPPTHPTHTQKKTKHMERAKDQTKSTSP